MAGWSPGRAAGPGSFGFNPRKAASAGYAGRPPIQTVLVLQNSRMPW